MPVKAAARGEEPARRAPGRTRSGWPLALAFALRRRSTAVLAGPPRIAEVVVVTSDPSGRPGALAGAERRGASSRARARRAERRAGARRRRWSRARGAGVAGSSRVCADLPALDATQLSEVLHAAASRDRAFVVDSAGTGTTVLLGPAEPAARARLRARLGTSACGRWRRRPHGVVAVGTPGRRRPARPGRRRRAGRRSVDGPRARPGLASPPCRRRWPSFDEQTGSGSVVTDLGVVIAYPASAFVRSGLRACFVQVSGSPRRWTPRVTSRW